MADNHDLAVAIGQMVQLQMETLASVKDLVAVMKESNGYAKYEAEKLIRLCGAEDMRLAGA